MSRYNVEADLRSILSKLLGLILAAIAITPAAAQPRPPMVLAAASLQESLTQAADAWAKRGHQRPVLSFAASSALARQVQAGAPADLFISADEPWMDAVQRQGLLKPGTRAALLSNRLVLIAPAASNVRLNIKRGFPVERALGTGRLAMADPDAVPAGKYGKAALISLGVWQKVSMHIAAAENVRAAMALVERGQAPLGIVYATDAQASRSVRVLGTFPPNSHPRITYPIATLKRSNSREAEAFRRFLLSPPGKAIFRRHGFITP